ncbi:unnamed protein product [Linum tenue]|uniref:Glutaredoxin domain-containing protein n=1 Tax=Linum tenue TaxID=586396 RepID=A0AAV0NXA5_9ROSI|nr:unnamed protein product [Linum tenue]
MESGFFLLQSLRIGYHERDVSMHKDYREELWEVLEGKFMPPRLFVKGRYIGGAEEVLGLNEQGKFRVLFEGFPPVDRSAEPCEACNGVCFVLCFNCSVIETRSAGRVGRVGHVGRLGVAFLLFSLLVLKLIKEEGVCSFGIKQEYYHNP